MDLETTGLRPGTSRICEIGAVRVREFELGETVLGHSPFPTRRPRNAAQCDVATVRIMLFRDIAEGIHRLEIAHTNVTETEKQCAIALTECFEQRDEA